MEFVYNKTLQENATEKVLVLCHPKKDDTDIFLKVVSMKILRKNIKDIELEFMSQPELYRLSDTEFMKSYEVNYRKYFDENLDINEGKIFINNYEYLSICL